MDIAVVPAHKATWSDLQAIFGTRGEPARCQCQWFKITAAEWGSVPPPERARRLHEQTNCGDPSATGTSGLVAYADGEPAGWCAVEPRTVYPRLSTARVPWAGRDESRTDSGVWAVTCFVTRTGFRRRGVSRALVAAAVGFARSRGARAPSGGAGQRPALPGGAEDGDDRAVVRGHDPLDERRRAADVEDGQGELRREVVGQPRHHRPREQHGRAVAGHLLAAAVPAGQAVGDPQRRQGERHQRGHPVTCGQTQR